MICRPSEHTVGRPRAKIRTRARRPRGRNTFPRPARGGLEPGGDGDLLGGPQPRSGEGQPVARGRRAAALLRGAPEPGGEREKGDPPLVEEPPNKEGGFSAGEAAGRERAPGGHNPGRREKPTGRL